MPDQDQRYHGHNVGENEFVLLDKLNEKAWIQTDYYIDLRQD